MNHEFFGDDVLLSSPQARTLYEGVRDLPIIDYHCHLNVSEIAEDRHFADLGELWLSGDHYKWRAMRMCGVPERYITGDADFHEKYLHYAAIFPMLVGNPLYYFTQLELKMLFGITEPLCADSAERIYAAAGEVLKTVGVRDILRRFRVQYVATTDDPASSLALHGRYGETEVAPTFRPDAALNLDKEALSALAKAAGRYPENLSEFKEILTDRLSYFREKGCRIADHGMDFLPVEDCGAERAAALFARRDSLTDGERALFFSHMLAFLAGEYAKADMVMQLHFGTYRNVNSGMLALLGRDAGFDIMRDHVEADRLALFFDRLQSAGQLPKTVLYSLNPAAVPVLATLSGAFARVRIGAAWWFNDTVCGIRRQLETVSEYAVLGTHLGMLTDSRSFSSYARFDFFRRILADTLGNLVQRGECDRQTAAWLMQKICYENVGEFLGFDRTKGAMNR